MQLFNLPSRYRGFHQQYMVQQTAAMVKKCHLKVPLLILVMTLVSFTATAVVMKPESVFLKILESNKHIYQFYMEVEVGVFDPEAFSPLDEDTDTGLIPYEIAEQSYQQRIIFIRDEFVAIETVDINGNVLHIYVKEVGGSDFSMNFNEERVFDTEDVTFPYLIFFTKHTSLVKSGLHHLGVDTTENHIGKRNYRTIYDLGSDEGYLHVDPNTFNVLELSYQLQYQGRYYPLSIEFSDWDPQRKVIPETTKFYLNSRLMKEVRISNMRYSGIFAFRNSFLKKYRNLFPENYPFSVEYILGQ